MVSSFENIDNASYTFENKKAGMWIIIISNNFFFAKHSQKTESN